jgi:diaminopimelate decarboxylase
MSHVRDASVSRFAPLTAAVSSRPQRRLPLDYWGFTAGPAGLALGGHVLSALARQFGTPFYAFDEARLRRNIRSASDAANTHLHARLHYSNKPNPGPRVAVMAREEALGAEVISQRELLAALAAGFDPEHVIFNGPGKRDEELALAVEHGVLVQVESAAEARALAAVAKAAGRTARAGVRVNPDVYDPRAGNGTKMGARASVFGMDPMGPEFDAAVTALAGSPHVILESLSASIGTGITSTEPFAHLTRVLATVRAQLAARGIAIRRLDGGGGFAVPSEVRYEDGGSDAIAAGRDVAIPAPSEIASFAEVCRAMAAELGNDVPEQFVLEPGRLLVADAFHLVARVVRLKEEGGQRFAVLDGGRTQNGMFVARGYHEIVHVRSPEARPHARYTLVGPLCATFDTYAERDLPELREGDLVAVFDVGAYNLSAQSRWCFDPAPVVALAGGEATIVPTHG